MSLVGVLLLAPLLVVLAGIYHFAATRVARNPLQLGYDRAALAIAVASTLIVTVAAYHLAPAARGPIWPHVYSALGGFFVMLLTLGLAWWRRPL